MTETSTPLQQQFAAWWKAQGKAVLWQEDGFPCGTPGVTEAWMGMLSLAAKCAEWNAKSAEKPGAKVRVYTANPDGSVSVEDRERIVSEIKHV